MTAAKLFSIIVFASTACYGVVGYYFLPMASFEGDLTRVAKLPESLFGWTKPQPAVAADLFKQASWDEADALVIGDSFSAPGIWQSVLTRHGLRVHTETWTSLPAICEDFSQWTRDKGFKGRYVIIEIVERNTEGTLNNSVACKYTHYRPAEWHPSPPAIKPNRDMNNHSGRLSIGIQVYLNTWRYRQNRNGGNLNSLEMPGSVHVDHLAEGCKLFSHPQCDDVLFFNQDQREELSDTVINNMKKIGSRVTNATPILVIIPNKSTIYLHPNKIFWNVAEHKLNAPNILAAFEQSIKAQVIDLYPANNTHLSTTGYLALGEIVYRSLPR